jgi:hypothetical protein
MMWNDISYIHCIRWHQYVWACTSTWKKSYIEEVKKKKKTWETIDKIMYGRVSKDLIYFLLKNSSYKSVSANKTENLSWILNWCT